MCQSFVFVPHAFFLAHSKQVVGVLEDLSSPKHEKGRQCVVDQFLNYPARGRQELFPSIYLYYNSLSLSKRLLSLLFGLNRGLFESCDGRAGKGLESEGLRLPLWAASSAPPRASLRPGRELAALSTLRPHRDSRVAMGTRCCCFPNAPATTLVCTVVDFG